MDASANLLFDIDLGLGLTQDDPIPCKAVSGMSFAVVNYPIQCHATYLPSVASASTPVIITVTYFSTLAANTTIDF
jgi:hypothetical protein